MLDSNETTNLAGAQGRAGLGNCIADDCDPLPRSLSRLAAVRLRRTRTSMAITPAVLAHFDRTITKQREKKNDIFED